MPKKITIQQMKHERYLQVVHELKMSAINKDWKTYYELKLEYIKLKTFLTVEGFDI